MRSRSRIMAVLSASLFMVALSWITLGLVQAASPAEPGGPNAPRAPQLVVSLVNESESNDTPDLFDAFGCGDVATGAVSTVGVGDGLKM